MGFIAAYSPNMMGTISTERVTRPTIFNIEPKSLNMILSESSISISSSENV